MIPAFDYRRALETMRPDLDAAIARVLSSGQLILGAEGEAFEREFAQFVGARSATGVASGTDALVVALRALGIGAGDEVITVSHTAAPTVGAIREAGAIPRFVDVAATSLLADPEAIPAKIGPRTRAIVVVHLYGYPADMPAILRIASAHDVAVIEDCAQAHGARIDGRHVGTFGTIGCFSFYPTKNLGAYGDAGMCVTDDGELSARMRQIRFHGFDPCRVAAIEGINSRLDELQAAILRIKLRHLDAALNARRMIAQQYLARLHGCDIQLPVLERGREHAWHLFVIRSKNRPRLIDALHRSGVGYGIHYPVPVHRMPAYERFGEGAGSLPVTEQATREILSLPMFPELTADEVETVCQVIRAASE